MTPDAAALRHLRLANLDPAIQAIINTIAVAGGETLIVGGTVRDALWNRPNLDIDLEIYNLTGQQLADCLTRSGLHFNIVGNAFGIINTTITTSDGAHADLDIAIARRTNFDYTKGEMAADDAHSPLTPREAAARRDFTINSLAYDPVADALFDFFGGQSDLENGILRHTSDHFAEDPLRVLRAMQFAARFELTLAPETQTLCASLVDQQATVDRERILAEWRKFALSSVRPSLGLRILRDTGWIANYLSLAPTIDTPQDPEWHPEGDVWTHTLHVVDEAVRIANRDQLDDHARWVLFLSALTHDISKPETTTIGDDGRVRSPGHAEEAVRGGKLDQFLDEIGLPPSGKSAERTRRAVRALVAQHMAHIGVESNPTPVRRLADRLMPSSIRMWARLVEADHCGRPPLPRSQPAADWVTEAERLNCADQRQAPIITGAFLFDKIHAPRPADGRQIGDMLRRAYKAQLNGAFANETDARDWIRRRLPAARLINGRDIIAAKLPVKGPALGALIETLFIAQMDGKFSDRETGVQFAIESVTGKGRGASEEGFPRGA